MSEQNDHIDQEEDITLEAFHAYMRAFWDNQDLVEPAIAPSVDEYMKPDFPARIVWPEDTYFRIRHVYDSGAAWNQVILPWDMTDPS